MKFCVCALAITSGILWGLVMLVVGVANFFCACYGQPFLHAMSSVYPGYHATHSVVQVIIGTLYGVVDGLIGGAVFAWLYNCLHDCCGKCCGKCCVKPGA